MEIVRKFVGNKEEAFQIIMDALINNVKAENGELVDTENIAEGFSYVKNLSNRFGKEGKVEVVITKLDVPNYYEAHFSSQQGLNILSYTLEEKR